MANRKDLYKLVDQLSPDQLEELYQYIRQRRQIVSFLTAPGAYPVVPDITQHEPAETIRDEVNALIDETIMQVRRKRETQDMVNA